MAIGGGGVHPRLPRRTKQRGLFSLWKDYPITAQVLNWPVTLCYGGQALDVVGITEIAKMFGVDRVSVSRWQSAGKLPLYDAFLPKRPLWYRTTILKWAEETGRPVVVEGPFSND